MSTKHYVIQGSPQFTTVLLLSGQQSGY